VDVGEDLNVVYVPHGARRQPHVARNAIPAALRLIGDAMGILSDADILDAVVYADGNLVVAAEPHERCDVELVGYAQRRVAAGRIAVNEDVGLDVRALQMEDDAAAAPTAGNRDRAAVPRRADIMLRGSEEKRKFHLTLDAIFLHRRVEVVGRVIQTAHPSGAYRHVVTLAVGQHRTGQRDLLTIVGHRARSEIPLSRKTDGLTVRGQTKGHKCQSQKQVLHLYHTSSTFMLFTSSPTAFTLASRGK
jgi:hypothetical protein